MGVHHHGWLRQAGAGCPVQAVQSDGRKIATKFKSRKFQDKLAALRIVRDDELMMVTSRGIIIRQAQGDFSSIEVSNRGEVHLDEDDAIAAVALV